MIRFIILAVVGYLFYRALKSWMFPAPDASKPVADKNIGKIDDVMIKDPYCEAYFPKRNAVHLNFDGKDLYFCSAECKDNYIRAQSGKPEMKIDD
jgi:YHS domain-containing protein